MNAVVQTYQTLLTCACCAALAAILAVAVSSVCGRSLSAIRRALSGRELAVFSLLAAACTFAAQKHLVSYPRTDPTQAYLVDNGSWVEGDLVHVDFRTLIVPSSASLFVDRRPLSSTSDADWVNHLATTIGEFRPPVEFEFAEATNYSWIVYTTWTPGPSVVTNGVWHAMWGRDRKSGRHAIPLRTAVRVDGRTIATPKSVRDAEGVTSK